MKNFDIKRFGTLLKCHLTENRKTVLTTFLGSVIGLFVMAMFVTEVVDNGSPEEFYGQKVENFAGVFTFVFIMAVMVSAARIFSNMKDTRQRTTFLMLPATSLEKYMVRLVYATVVMSAVYAAAFVVADLLRMLVAPLRGHEMVSAVAWFFSDGNANTPLLLWLCIAGMLLITHSVYVLGGALFRRQPFLITSFLIFIGWMLLMYIMEWTGILHAANRLTFISINNGHLDVHPLIYVYLIVNYLLVAVFYWLSYRMFTHMQVINNKWLNV